LPPQTRYAKSGDVSIAYQVVGDGEMDVVWVPGWVSHLELAWDGSLYARFLQRLASFSRLILFDKRGTGLSDRVSTERLPTLEERMDDLRAVMDAVGSERAVLFGASEGGPMSALFAAAYPERTRALIMYGSFARWCADPPEYPWGMDREFAMAGIEAVTAYWGDNAHLLFFWAPTLADDASFRSWWDRSLLISASPSAGAALLRMNAEIDVRDVLPAIHVPTLIIHRSGDRFIDVDHGQYLARHIEGAKYVELPGDDHLWYVGDQGEILDEIEEFLTGVRPVPEVDRILATVLFTDIVDSTKKAAELGDRRWRRLLEDHHNVTRKELERFRGREVKMLGDGILATFDGPGRSVRCAHALRDALRSLGIEIRAGIHTGECEVMDGDVGGVAVHIGARILGMASPGEVLVSSTVKDLVSGSGIAFEDRGAHQLKGVPGEWRLFSVQSH
jgi:class 3 adenylate cyclase